MHFSLSTLVLSLAASQHALAYPGLQKTLYEVHTLAEQAERSLSTDLLGNLRTLRPEKRSSAGKAIAGILEGTVGAQSDDIYHYVPARKSKACRDQVCCKWKYIADDMEKKFVGNGGLCTKWARFAIRLGFHDAASWSLTQGKTGADGSIVLAAEERERLANRGLQEMIQLMEVWYAQYHDREGWSDVTMADLIQVAAHVATVSCPMGPRIRMFVGRRDSAEAAPDGLLPSPFGTAEQLIQLFEEKTISAPGLIALLGAHSTSQQNFVNQTRAGDPQDSTPGVMDVLYYRQTLSSNAPKRVFKFVSDVNLAQHSSTSDDFVRYARDQRLWQKDYAREYVRLSLLGVADTNGLTECTKALPRRRHTGGHFHYPDQTKLDKWLSDQVYNTVSKEVATDLEAGNKIAKDLQEVPGSPKDVKPLSEQENAKVEA